MRLQILTGNTQPSSPAALVWESSHKDTYTYTIMISPLNINILNMYVAPEYLGAIKDERIHQKHVLSSTGVYTVDKKQSGWLDILTVLLTDSPHQYA